MSGYLEEGTITTAFDMRVRNEIDRYHQMLKLIKYVDIDDKLKSKIKTDMQNKLKQHKKYIEENGVDMPEIENWNWNK